MSCVFGDDWQDNYFIWDCAAGTGNLLAGLKSKNNVWASTLDSSDVDVMKERIKNGANLIEDHVFQFDFLNDDFSKLPVNLQNIISNEQKRKKLIIYINPPYAETMSHGVKHKAGLNQTMVNMKYQSQLGNCANRELFIQFLVRIYFEIPDCIIAIFSTLKLLNAPHFNNFRALFKAELKTLFLVPANTFDNVKGKFPVGFHIWDTGNKQTFKKITADVFNEDEQFAGNKTIICYDDKKFINEWIVTTRNRPNENIIGFMACLGNDFQQTNVNYIMNDKSQMASPRGSWITDKNLIEISIYFAVRHCIAAGWLNDRDQFLFPNNDWKNDIEFQNDCLTFTLFKNIIQSGHGVNHWIPFSEIEVNAKNKFKSSFMHDYINGRTYNFQEADLLTESKTIKKEALQFSDEAKVVFNAGKKLWQYYHSQPAANENASLYDIKEFFQGRTDNGKMKSKSDNENYNELIKELRQKISVLAEKIQPKVYKYGFLAE